jgi:Fe/S biogenesis protein NfuA
MMITLTDVAKSKVKEFIDQAGDECKGLRIQAIKVGRYTYRYQLNLVRDQDLGESDTAIEHDDFTMWVDPQTAEWMEGATIDFLTMEGGAGFQIENPAADPKWEDPICQKVQEVIDHKVLPVVGAHGGWVELDRVEGDTAYVALGGGCQGCASASFTLKEGIESVITKEVPEIEHVQDVTDHSEGSTPYYSS